jgi:PKHD-type hydroxylase
MSRGRMRLDLSATLFLSSPEEYKGGELVITGQYDGEQSVKLPAGDMILYKAGSTHRVKQVEKGLRECCFFWVQSLVRESDQREILFHLDAVIQNLSNKTADDDNVMLMHIYHNLLRLWSDI